MNLFREIHEENMVILLDTLIRRIREGKQTFKYMEYLPISFLIDRNEDSDSECCVTQMFRLITEFNGIEYELELSELISFPSEKGDIAGSISSDGLNGYQNYDFGLSYDIENYDDCQAGDLAALYGNSLPVRVAEAIVMVFKDSAAVDEGFSFARFYNETDVKPKWKRNRTVRACNRLMDSCDMKGFHRTILDMEYRKKVVDSIEQE